MNYSIDKDANRTLTLVLYILYIIAFIPFFFLFFTGENADLFAGVALIATTFCILVVGISWIWIVYRAIRGMIRLNDNQAMYQ